MGKSKLDPMPYMIYYNGLPSGGRRNFRKPRFQNFLGEAVTERFEPREGFSTNEEDYVKRNA